MPTTRKGCSCSVRSASALSAFFFSPGGDSPCQKLPTPVPRLPGHAERSIGICAAGKGLLLPGKTLGWPPMLSVLKVQTAAIGRLADLLAFLHSPCRPRTLPSVRAMAPCPPLLASKSLPVSHAKPYQHLCQQVVGISMDIMGELKKNRIKEKPHKDLKTL